MKRLLLAPFLYSKHLLKKFKQTSAPSSAPFLLEIAENKKESLGNSLV